jgi:hypothetical protein
MMTFEFHLGSWEEPEVTQSKMWRIQGLKQWWNLVLQQKVLHHVGGVPGHIVMAWHLVFSPFSSLLH